MNASPSTLNAHAPGGAAAPRRLVTDAATRMFHALFALSFVGAYLTAESERWRLLHVTLGYCFAGLLVFRLVDGLFGPRQAGLGLWWRKLAAAAVWLRSFKGGSGVNGRQGQHLAMALVVVLILALVLPLTLSGYATYNDWGDGLGGEWLEETHEFFGNALLLLVGVHLGLILLFSLLRRQNLALRMLTGRVPGAGPNPVRHPRRGLAALQLLAVLAFGAWQWHDAPNGLVPGWGAVTGTGHARNADNGDGDHSDPILYLTGNKFPP